MPMIYTSDYPDVTVPDVTYLWHRLLLWRPASEYGGLCQGKGPEAWSTPPPEGLELAMLWCQAGAKRGRSTAHYPHAPSRGRSVTLLGGAGFVISRSLVRLRLAVLQIGIYSLRRMTLSKLCRNYLLPYSTSPRRGCRSGFPSCARRCQYGPWLASPFCGVDREVLLWGVMPPRQARGQPLHPIYALATFYKLNIRTRMRKGVATATSTAIS